MRYSVGSHKYRSNLASPFDSPTSNNVIYQISSHLVHKQGHYGNIFNFWQIWKKVWGRVINPLWCLKAPSPATKNSAQNLDSETIFKPFGLEGWLKVSYLLD